MKRLLIGLTAAALAAAVALLGGAFREPEAAAVELPAFRAKVPSTVEELQSQLRLDPDDPDALALLGLAYQQRARETGDAAWLVRSEGVLLRARSLAPGHPVAVSGLGSLALSRHRFRDALSFGRAAQAADPGSERHAGIVVDALVELGRYREAFAELDRLAARKPGLTAYARVAYARELTGDRAGAVEAMELAVAAAPFGEPAAWARTLTGNLLVDLRRFAAAEVRFREALAVVGGYPPALAGLGDIALRRGAVAKAVSYYRRAAAGSRLSEHHVALGDLLQQLGRREQAERAWRRAEELERLFAASGGRNLLETAEFDLNHDRNLRSALDRARRGRADRPSVEGDHVLAWALYKNGLCAEARPVSLRSLRLGTQDVDGFYHHALIEECLGNEQAAARYRARVERLDPTYLERAPSARRLRA